MPLQRVELDVEIADADDPNVTTEHHLKIANTSLVAWDRIRASNGWPAATDAPILWMTYLAWHHMKAAGLIDCKYAEFESTRCVAIESPDGEDIEGSTDLDDEGKPYAIEDPTRPGVDPGSPLS